MYKGGDKERGGNDRTSSTLTPDTPGFSSHVGCLLSENSSTTGGRLTVYPLFIWKPTTRDSILRPTILPIEINQPV